jgi:hypothetical protein
MTAPPAEPESPTLWVRNDGDGWIRLHKSTGAPDRERHPVIASWRAGDPMGELLASFLPSGPGAMPECTCYPGGFTHDTFEGPQPWCDVHGLPSAAWDIQRRRIDALEAEAASLRDALAAEQRASGAWDRQ